MRVGKDVLAFIENAITTGQARVTAGPRKGDPKPEQVAEVPIDPDAHVCVFIPVKTRTHSNWRAHWAVKSKHAKQHRNAVTFAFQWVDDHTRRSLRAGCQVRLTRVAARKLDRHNLPDAFKHLIDQIAVEIFGGRVGQHDDCESVSWEFGQLATREAKTGVIVTARCVQRN